MSDFVHYCVFCGWSREAQSLTMLEPACERCGCTLRAETREGYDRLLRSDSVPTSPTVRGDASPGFAVVVKIAIVLPILGFDLGDVVFALPLIVLTFTATRCWAAARRTCARPSTWMALALAAALGALSSLVGLLTAFMNLESNLVFYLGSLASVTLLVAVAPLAARGLRQMTRATAVDCLLVALIMSALGGYFVALPGFDGGDSLLTGVAVADLVAVIMAAVAAVASRDPHSRGITLWIVAAMTAVFAGDTLVSSTAAGQMAAGPVPTAVLWTLAGYLLAVGADLDRPLTAGQVDRSSGRGVQWEYAQAALPLAAVLTLPAVTVVVWLAGGLDRSAAIYFSVAASLVLLLVLGRQAHLVLDNRRAADRERRLREETVRRNEELEALTDLATTMTQTLEEGSITEQALKVLHMAAGAAGSALHVRESDGRYRLCAAAGDWQTVATWAGNPPAGKPSTATRTRRGQREIVALPVVARGNDIGIVTLVRAATSPFEEGELRILRLLVDELAIAIQNARDYREKLEQAIRDPLTGVYNRRYFFEALEKEVRRSERYSSEASLVIFDVDNFKQINDVHGHAAGDQVLREITRAIEDAIRPTDSLARIGGEEFALLLPETNQLDALLVAERARTAISRRPMLEGRQVTASGGAASCPQDATSRDDLHRRADAALYWSKRNGRDICALAGEVNTAAPTPGDSEGMVSHLHAIVAGIDAKHLHTRGHSENVAAYAAAVGRALGLDGPQIIKLRRAALLHDVGKVAVAGEVLAKPGTLTEEEYEQVKLHSEVGGSMLLHGGLTEEAEWVRHHHERVDGGGYPSGLRGDEIPFEARILFIADSFEAMTSDRPYRAGMSVEEALGELRRCSGTQFESSIVAVFEGLVQSGEMPLLCLRTNELRARTSGHREAADDRPQTLSLLNGRNDGDDSSATRTSAHRNGSAENGDGDGYGPSMNGGAKRSDRPRAGTNGFQRGVGGLRANANGRPARTTGRGQGTNGRSAEETEEVDAK